MHKTYIGVDPGKSGGFAIIGEDTVIVKAWDDNEFIAKISNKRFPCFALVEKVSAMPKQGVVSMFNFGKSAGFIEGVLSAVGIPYQLVPPNVWKREYSLIKKEKKDSLSVCKKLFPDVSLRRTDRCKVDHDGMAEALLIAEYARRHGM